MITLQATIIAYIDDFKLLMILSLAAMPLVLLLRKPAHPGRSITAPSWNNASEAVPGPCVGQAVACMTLE